jgi:hypothetical protein
MLSRFISSLLLVALLNAAAHGQQINEYQMKAAYLYNFAKFVDWPPEAFKSAADPISICMLDQSALLHTVEEAVNGETVDDRKLVVRQITDPRLSGNCHILFIGSSDLKLWHSELRGLKTGILTVGESDGFIAAGGVVNLRLNGNKVRIEINVNAAERQKLRISPKLLSLAQTLKR